MTRRIAAVLAIAALVAGCGGGDGSPSSPAQPATPASFPATVAGAEGALQARLEARSLSTHYVRCAASDATSGRGEPIFRCNVNFGEPHIWPYCVVVRDGAAVTNVEEPALRCRRTRTGDEP
ncbi:MAG: hypothetical protein U0237_12740 [Thermoleophilia bacterium]